VIVERLRQSYASGAQRIINPASLLFAGLTSTNRGVRTLLWTVAIDALLMAANREQFCTRILALLDAATVILPRGVDGIRPKYTVADVIESLYDYRGHVAHGKESLKGVFKKQRTAIREWIGHHTRLHLGRSPSRKLPCSSFIGVSGWFLQLTCSLRSKLIHAGELA
jgi:hypothetical protein